MAAARKRSQSKARTGTAGTPKTAQRKSPGTKARTKTTGRVKGARGGAAHDESKPQGPTKRQSSRQREQEVETASNRRAKKSPAPPTDLTEGDVAKIPGMARARAMDTGDNAVAGKKRTRRA